MDICLLCFVKYFQQLDNYLLQLNLKTTDFATSVAPFPENKTVKTSLSECYLMQTVKKATEVEF